MLHCGATRSAWHNIVRWSRQYGAGTPAIAARILTEYLPQIQRNACPTLGIAPRLLMCRVWIASTTMAAARGLPCRAPPCALCERPVLQVSATSIVSCPRSRLRHLVLRKFCKVQHRASRKLDPRRSPRAPQNATKAAPLIPICTARWLSTSVNIGARVALVRLVGAVEGRAIAVARLLIGLAMVSIGGASGRLRCRAG
jgi:hypothetical protein